MKAILSVGTTATSCVVLKGVGGDKEVVTVVDGPLIVGVAVVRKERSKSDTEKVCLAQVLPRLESRICSNSEALG